MKRNHEKVPVPPEADEVMVTDCPLSMDTDVGWIEIERALLTTTVAEEEVT